MIAVPWVVDPLSSPIIERHAYDEAPSRDKHAEELTQDLIGAERVLKRVIGYYNIN